MSEWISDFTPTIQDMRETYEETWHYAPHTNSAKEKNAEFDRFLELVYQVERERIIKLLDTDFWHHTIWGHEQRKCVKDCSTCELIALIKGETNE